MERNREGRGLAYLCLVLGSFLLASVTPSYAAANSYCWGENTYNALGTGDTTEQDSPYQGSDLVSMGQLSAISAGQKHTCGILLNGTLMCWGHALNGALGPNATPGDTANGPVTASTRAITSVACGNAFTCAIDTSGNLSCWGSCDYGQLGDGTVAAGGYFSTERNVTSLSQVTYVTAGKDFACAVVANGTGYCWGLNAQGQLGTGNMNNVSVPGSIAVPAGVTISKISTGLDHACALTTSYELYCWGNNKHGELGAGDGLGPSVPTPVKVNGTYLAVGTGQEVTCALTLAGSQLFCWGYAQNGILGDGATGGNQSVPQNVTALAGSQFVSVSAGYTAAFAVRTDGQTFSWGRANTGQLGRGSSLSSGAIYTPAPVTTPTGTVFGSGVTIHPFGSFACAIITAIPSPSPSPSPSRSPSPSSTSSPSPSPSTSLTPIFNPSPFPSATPTASPSLSVTLTPTPSATPSLVPVPTGAVQAEFNRTVPAVAISGGEAAATQQIDLNLASLQEISSSDGSVLQTIDLQTVGWTVEKNESVSGNITEYSFTSKLEEATGGANNATLQYTFNTYALEQLVTTGSNYTFTITPSFLKFSLGVSSWTWKSASGKLRLTLKIVPSFVRFSSWQDTPQEGMTTFLFSGAKSDQASTVVRLLNFGEEPDAAGGGGQPTRVPLNATAAVDGSSLALTFDHFETDLLFDPDIGLLLGTKGDGSGGDNMGLIIGVAVAVPLAVLFVVVVIAAASVVIYLKRRADMRSGRGAVGFDAQFADDQL